MLLLPLLAFLFASLLVAAGGDGAGAQAGRDNRAAPRRGDRQPPSTVRSRIRRTSRRPFELLKRLGSVAPEVAVGDGQAPAAARRGRLPGERGARRLLRHPRRLRAAAVRAVRDAAPHAAEPSAGARRVRPRLRPAGHGARADGETAPAPHPARAARRARPARRQRRSRARPRPGDSARRRRSWPSRIPTCPTSCGSSTSSCAPARRAPRRCTTSPIGPASTT